MEGEMFNFFYARDGGRRSGGGFTGEGIEKRLGEMEQGERMNTLMF